MAPLRLLAVVATARITWLSYLNQCYHCHQWLLPCPPPDRTLGLLVVAGCMATAAGGFGSVVLFAVALVGVPYPKRLCLAALLVVTAVSFAAAGLTIAGLLGLLAAAIPPFGFAFCFHRRCHGF